MKSKVVLCVAGLVVSTFLLWVPTPGFALPVSTELVLLADVSSSLDDTDFALQRDGYAAAFRNANVINAVEAYGDIAVTLVYWSNSQAVAVDWMHVHDAVSAEAFAAAIENAPRPFGDRTALARAIDYGASLFENNGFEGVRQVMDVSGDGADNVDCSYDDPICQSSQAARDAALLGGVDMINAIFIRDPDAFGDDPGDYINALEYGQNNVIGGEGAFVDLVQGYDTFADGVAAKITRELQPPTPTNTPEPGTLLLLGFGLVGLVGLKRKKYLSR